MALLPILKYPDPRLATKAAVVTEFDDKLKQLAADMAETMYKAPGVGLAATQVDRHIRLIVIDITEEKNDLKVLVNPELVESSEETKPWEEGCLSLPGIYDKVTRPANVKVKAQDLEGNFFELECDGLLAVCVQHEMDHLEGTVFVDHLSMLKKQRIRHKIRKMRLEEERAAKKKPDLGFRLPNVRGDRSSNCLEVNRRQIVSHARQGQKLRFRDEVGHFLPRCERKKRIVLSVNN